MKKLFLAIIPLLLLAASCGNKKQTKQIISDESIKNAYAYLLSRDLVIRQQQLDFKEGFKWNELIHRQPGQVQWANPNLDVAYSEAWIAIDENTCVLLEIPQIKNRYYTWQMLNTWGETLLNINERTFPKQPYGKYAICLKGSNPKIPQGALRVDIPCKVSRVLARVELGNNAKEAIRLQHLFKITPQGNPVIDSQFEMPSFEGFNLPGVKLFDDASALIDSETDINPSMDSIQATARAIEKALGDKTLSREHVDSVIAFQFKSELLKMLHQPGPSQNGWSHPRITGNYGDDYWMRMLVNFAGIWANNKQEAVYFTNTGLDGGNTYIMTFPKNALPALNAKYFWSVIAVDAEKFQVLPNSLKRYLLNKQSGLKHNADGSLTLVFSPQKPTKYPVQNWLPTIAGEKYNLTFRFYGPSESIINGQYFPPQMVKQ